MRQWKFRKFKYEMHPFFPLPPLERVLVTEDSLDITVRLHEAPHKERAFARSAGSGLIKARPGEVAQTRSGLEVGCTASQPEPHPLEAGWRDRQKGRFSRTRPRSEGGTVRPLCGRWV